MNIRVSLIYEVNGIPITRNFLVTSQTYRAIIDHEKAEIARKYHLNAEDIIEKRGQW